jgi:hypothetical protein
MRNRVLLSFIHSKAMPERTLTQNSM